MRANKLLDVTLEEANHIYTDQFDNRYDSVTTIIGKYKEPFDAHKIMKNGKTLLENYVDKNGFTPEYWLDQWERKKNHACERGTAFHKLKEDATIHENLFKHDFKRYPYQDFEKEIDLRPGIDYSQLPDGSYSELTIFNRRLMIAGQVDLVVKEGNYVDIDDYKTNGKFETKSFSPPRSNKYKMMQFPVQSLMDCHLGHYTLQLSLYAWMLSLFGLKIRRLRVLHYTILEEDERKIYAGENLDHLEPEIYPIEYKPKLVEKMVQHYRTKVRPL